MNTAIAEGDNNTDFDIAPETTPQVVEAVKQIPANAPFQPTWASLQAHYEAPSWLIDPKLGLFMN